MIILKDRDISKIDIINNAIFNAKYVLDDAIPYRGIKKVFSVWTVYLFLSNLSLLLYWRISDNIGFTSQELFYSINRVCNILLCIISIMIYAILINKIEMTLKEKNFLKSFTIFPILLSLLKAGTYISYYVNIDIMIQIYDSFSVDLIITFIAIYQIYRYFKSRYLKYLIYMLFSYICMAFILKFYIINTMDINNLLSQLYNIIEISDFFCVYQIVVFGMSSYLIKEKKDE